MNLLQQATKALEQLFWPGVPPVVTVPAVLVTGVAAAVCTRVVLRQVLELGRFNVLCARIGFSEFLRKGQVHHSPARLAGLLAYWAILLVTVLLVLHLMGVALVASLVSQAGSALPAVVTAACVVFFGWAMVWFCANLLYTLARNGGFAYADLLSRLVKWVGMLLIVSLAADQLGVEFRLIGSALQIALAAAAFGVALAFGLGCKDLARDAMQRYLQHLRERKTSDRGDLEG